MTKLVPMKERVEKGATLLDEHIPDWYTRVHSAMTAGYFNMNNWDRCVAGTLEIVRMGYRDGPIISFNGTKLVGYREAEEYGFVAGVVEDAHNDAWEQLEACWKEEVRKRLKSDATKIEKGDIIAFLIGALFALGIMIGLASH
jgi:hypothetical protein